MSELLRRTFRLSFDLELIISQIDEHTIAAAQRRMHLHADEHILNEPDIDQAFLQRDQALLQALLQHPTILQAFLIRRAAEAAENIDPDDDSLDALQRTIDDGALVERLRDALSAVDYTFLKDVCDAGLFFDNTSYFDEAITLRQTNFALRVLPEKDT